MDFTKPWHERAYEYRREAGAPMKKKGKRSKPKSKQAQVRLWWKLRREEQRQREAK